MDQCYLNTKIGTLKVCGDTNGITKITRLKIKVETTNPIPESLQNAIKQIEDYFNNKTESFSFKINPEGTDFQRKVWNTLLTIPYGKTTSYLQLAKQLGDIKAIRAIANANAKNPILIIIPCHRVIGSNGELVGYSGGLPQKEWLLNHEKSLTQGVLF